MINPMTRSRLSHWFPVVARVLAPIAYPRTEIVGTPSGCDLDCLLDGDLPNHYDQFLVALSAAGKRIGYPCFLRCDQSAAKHDYAATCHVPSAVELPDRLVGLLESWCAWGEGTGTNVWAVRELLPVAPAFLAFRGLPIGPEWRVLTKGGCFEESFPYWPLGAFYDRPRAAALADGSDAIAQPTVHADVVDPTTREPLAYPELCRRFAKITRLSEHDRRLIEFQSLAVTGELGGDWSVDWMIVPGRGPVLIDMAAAELSWRPDERDLTDWLCAT